MFMIYKPETGTFANIDNVKPDDYEDRNHRSAGIRE